MTLLEPDPRVLCVPPFKSLTETAAVAFGQLWAKQFFCSSSASVIPQICSCQFPAVG